MNSGTFRPILIFPFAQTSNSWLSVFIRVPTSFCSWAGCFPKKSACWRGHCAHLQRHLGSGRWLPPFGCTWVSTVHLQVALQHTSPIATQRHFFLPKEAGVRFADFWKTKYNYQPVVAHTYPQKDWKLAFLKGFPELFCLIKISDKGGGKKKKTTLHNISSMQSFCHIIHFFGNNESWALSKAVCSRLLAPTVQK